MEETERALLEWLSQEDGQYGECYGTTLDALLACGFVEIKEGIEHQGGFIAKGSGKMYQAVAITEAGRAALKAT